jgi:heat shock protein HslJ
MSKLIRLITVLLVLLLIPGAIACKNSSPLEGTRWSLIEINGGELVDGTYISLSFYGSSAEGNGGCNRYHGEYSTEDPNILNIQEPGHTEEGCVEPEGVMEQEDTYFRALSNAATYEIINDNLVIYGQDNQKLLVFKKIRKFQMDPADLVGTAWQLESMNDTPVPDRLSITLTFNSDNQASGRSGVFEYRLDYTASGDRISWGIASWRTGELPGELETYALDYTDSIASANQYNLAGDRLEIFTSRGDVLVYEPVAP